MSQQPQSKSTKTVPVPAELVGGREVSNDAIALPTSEIEAQVSTAKKWPRDVQKFLDEAKAMVAINEEIAASCLYTLERWDPDQNKKVPLVGKSVRFAEIVLYAWGNCHAGARPADEAQWHVTAQGAFWDFQKNVRVTWEATRPIRKRNGERYSLDMIVTTMNAAAAIAFRNAILRGIPAALTDEIFKTAKAAAVGEVQTRRSKVIQSIVLLGATVERILAVIDRPSIEDITIDDLQILIGYRQVINEGDRKVEEIFPVLPTKAAAETPTPSNGNTDAKTDGKPKGQTTLADVTAASREKRSAAVQPVSDADAADRDAAAPSAKEIAARDAELQRQKSGGRGDDMPDWAR